MSEGMLQNQSLGKINGKEWNGWLEHTGNFLEYLTLIIFSFDSFLLQKKTKKKTKTDGKRREVNIYPEVRVKRTGLITQLTATLTHIRTHLLGVKWKRCLHSSQYSFREYLSHCTRQSWWMNLMLPVQMHGWKRGLSLLPSQRHTRQISETQGTRYITRLIWFFLSPALFCLALISLQKDKNMSYWSLSPHVQRQKLLNKALDMLRDW